MIVDGFEITEKIARRFHAKVKRGAPNECWPWLGAPHRAGYGRLHVGGVKGRHLVAARIALALFDGENLGPGIEACHRCDNPICVNGAHLFRGTHLDNMLDRDRKGRVASGDRHGSATKPERRARGERHGDAKLTPEQVIAIRREHQPHVVSYTDLAKKYEVAPQTIGDIVRRRRWKHLEAATP